jgi:hypothetical protein
VLARRLLMLAAVLMLLTALAAGLAPRQETSDVTPLSPAGPAPASSGRTIARTIPAAPGSDTRVRVRRGDLLRLEVAGDALDTVWLERLDRVDAIDPSSPARFELLIDESAGDYPIRLVEADRRIGAIEIGAAAVG